MKHKKESTKITIIICVSVLSLLASQIIYAQVTTISQNNIHSSHVVSQKQAADAVDPELGNGSSWNSDISHDGRFVVFSSSANNLIAGDTNGKFDIFLHDRLTKRISRISVATDGTQANDDSNAPSISADGRYIAFVSEASNLVEGDTNLVNDAFVHDRVTQEATRVSVAADGSQGNSSTYFVTISADGAYVTFQSSAHNLVENDTNNVSDIFIHERATGNIERIVAANGSQSNGYSAGPVIAAQGKYVAFYSSASNLVPGDDNQELDIFLYDRETEQLELISVASDGTQANADSIYPSISDDGRYVVFNSEADNLVAGDTNEGPDAFVYDSLTATTTRVSVASGGIEVNAYPTNPSDISGDGRYVVFDSGADNVVPNDTNGSKDVFVYDRETNQTARVSLASDGSEGNAWSRRAFLSGDGRYVSFESAADNFVGFVEPNSINVYVHDNQTGLTEGVSFFYDIILEFNNWLPTVVRNE